MLLIRNGCKDSRSSYCSQQLGWWSRRTSRGHVPGGHSCMHSLRPSEVSGQAERIMYYHKVTSTPCSTDSPHYHRMTSFVFPPNPMILSAIIHLNSLLTMEDPSEKEKTLLFGFADTVLSKNRDRFPSLPLLFFFSSCFFSCSCFTPLFFFNKASVFWNRT